MRCGGNLRNGSNAGLSYLNCRNRLRNANWNYLSANFVNYNHTINAASYFGCQRASCKHNCLCCRRLLFPKVAKNGVEKKQRLVTQVNTSYAQNRVMNERGFYMKRKCKNVDITDINMLKKARKVVSNYDKAKVRLQIA